MIGFNIISHKVYYFIIKWLIEFVSVGSLACLTIIYYPIKKLMTIFYIVISKFFMSLFVWIFKGSASGHIRDMRPVSLKPVWLEVQIFENNFPQKWPVAKLTNKMSRPLTLFYGKSLLYILPFILNGQLLAWNKCRGNNFLLYYWHRNRDIDIGMQTLYRVKAGENFLKGALKDSFRILFITSLKTKGGPKRKIFDLQLWPYLKDRDKVSRLGIPA